MKKSVVFIITIFVLSLLAPFVGVRAASFVNGGFETANSSNPEGWTADGGNFGSALVLSSTDPAEGTQSLCITADRPTTAIQTVPVTPQKRYVFSGYYRIELLSDKGNVAVYTACNNEANSVGETITEAENTWKRFSFSFITESTVTSCTISLSVTGGTAYFDGITFSESGILLNGSFANKTSDGYPTDWHTSDGWEALDSTGAAFFSCISDGYSGNAVSIRNLYADQSGIVPEKRNPYIRQSVICESSAEYILSGYFRADAAASVVIKVENYADRTNFASKNHSLTGDSSWKPFSIPIVTAENETQFNLLFRILGKGQVAFDEISLFYKGQSGATLLRIEPEDIFAYENKQNGKATITLMDDAAQGSRITLSLLDGNTTLFSMDATANDSVTFSYDNTKMQELGKGYTLLTQLRTAGGSVLDEASETIYRYARPSHLNKDGMFTDHSGNIVKPVIAYHVPVADYEKLAEIGVNVVQCIYTSAYPDAIAEALDKAESLGLYLMIPLYADMKPAGSPENRERTLACIERFKDHKALYAWMVMDEPQPMYDEMYEALKASYKLIRDADPAHPIYICECNPKSYALSGRCCDILCIDPYPDTLSNIDRVYSDTVLALEATNFEKPVYNLLQAWQWNTDWTPSAHQLRQMIYQAILAGAKGFGYYPIRDSSSTMYTLPLWNGAASFSRFEKDPLLTAFWHGKAPDVQKTDTYLYAESKEFIFALNRTDTEITLEIPTVLSGNPIILNGDAIAEKTIGGISLQLSAYSAACIEMTSTPRIFIRKNGLLAYKADSGSYTVQTANSSGGKVYIAVYEGSDEKKQLLQLHVGTDAFEINCMPEKTYSIQGFFWDGTVPLTKVFTLS